MPESRAIRVLLTGGAGYIGSHTYLALCEAGLSPVILDDFSNSNPAVLSRLSKLAGRTPEFERGDVCDGKFVADVLHKHQPDVVVHFAGSKSVGESVTYPLRYYRNNLVGAVTIIDAIEKARSGVPAAFLFSSSATVYGEPKVLPIKEDAPRSSTNPYGHTKLVIEDMLQAVQTARSDWRIGILRYFNPVGAHRSGLIGEDPTGVPNNLMPYVAQVAVGSLPFVKVFGNDYATRDGTGVRDYIHVEDLAAGHVAAVQALVSDHARSFTVNLGTGQGHSVLEVISAFENASNLAVRYRLVGRRPGDVPECYADPTLAKELLGWKAKRNLEEMCADTWRWQRNNPRGYRD